MTFQEALVKHFKFRGSQEHDNLPILSTARRPRRQGETPGAIGIAKLMCDLGFREGAEIGTNTGNSAKIWCGENPQLHLTCIDPYKPYNVRPSPNAQNETYKQACENLEPFNVTMLRECSLNAVSGFKDSSLDFVFIDGDHRFDAVMQDLIRWTPKVRKGGLVILHDYTVFQGAGVIHAVNAYTHCHRIEPWYVTRDYLPTVFWERGAEHL